MSGVRTSSIHALKGIAVRDAGNVLRTAALARLRDTGGSLRTVFSVLGAGLSSSDVFGSVNSGQSRNVQTTAVLASASGGAVPYSFLWERIDADPAAWTINSQTSAWTTFTAQGVEPGTSYTAEFRCTITDANGSTALTGTVTAMAANIYVDFTGVLP